MSITDLDIRGLSDAARYEVASRHQPFNQNVTDILAAFREMEARPGSTFRLNIYDLDIPEPGTAVFQTTVGIFQVQENWAGWQQAHGTELIIFNENGTPSKSLSSEVIRLAQRRAYTNNQISGPARRDDDIERLIDAGRVEITTRQFSFSEQLETIEQYFARLAKRPELQFNLSVEKLMPDHVIYKTTLGTFDITPRQAKLQIEGEEDVSFFSSADVTASLVSATIRFVERRIGYVNSGMRDVPQPT